MVFLYRKDEESPIVLVTRKQSTPAQTSGTSTIFALGSAITKDVSEISGAHLPTGRQVLCCVMFHLQQGVVRAVGNVTKWESVKTVLSQVSTVYPLWQGKYSNDFGTYGLRKNYQAS